MGDELELTAGVAEYFGMTELRDLTALSRTREGRPLLPTAVSTGTIGTACSASAEPYEGLLVQLSGVTISGAADRWGRMGVDDGSGMTRLDDDIFEYDSLLVQVPPPPR